MDNQEIIEKIYRLQLAVRDRNGIISSALEKSTIPLLEHEAPLQSATLQDLLKIKGIGERTADLILRVIAGEHPYEIAQQIEPPKKRSEESRYK